MSLCKSGMAPQQKQKGGRPKPVAKNTMDAGWGRPKPVAKNKMDAGWERKWPNTYARATHRAQLDTEPQ